jgi:hypothetical protein
LFHLGVQLMFQPLYHHQGKEMDIKPSPLYLRGWFT